MAQPSMGRQLYAQLAQLLAPTEDPDHPTVMVVIEPSGKDVALVGDTTTADGLEALADLANVIPVASTTFLDSGDAYDDIWKLVLDTATPTGAINDPVRIAVSKLLLDNQSDFDMAALVRRGLPPSVYRPVLAEPRDWLSEAGWASVSFRIGGDQPSPVPTPPPMVVVPDEIPDIEWLQVLPLPGVTEIPEIPVLIDPWNVRIDSPDPKDLITNVHVVNVIEAMHREQRVFFEHDVALGDDVGLQDDVVPEDALLLEDAPDWKGVWTTERELMKAAKFAPADAAGSGFELAFEYRVVGLRRTWLRKHLCRFAGWSMPGLPPEALSTGTAVDNDGLMPLLTTRMLVVRNLVLRADWTAEELARAQGSESLAFGPFVLMGAGSFDGTELERRAPQVIAWLADVVPASPPQ